MTIEEAIKYIDVGWPDGSGGIYIGREYSWQYKEAVNVAISALRAQQEAEKNEPLTWEELQEMDEKPVWLVSNSDDFACWGIVRVYMETENRPIAVLCAERIYSGGKNYGKLWSTYRHPPKETHNV